MANQVKRVATPPSARLQQGMSLLELMISIGIMLVLIVIAVPAYSRITQMKEQATCSAHLRQIGVAVLTYASDHRDVLPGPMTATQRASYTSHQIKTAPVSLLHYIAPYLGLVPPLTKQYAVVFQCPAQAKLRRGEEDPVFYLHRDTVFENGSTQRPFGYQAANATPLDPMRLANVASPGKTVAIFDTSGTAAQPEVHPLSRNVLFIDGHVESVERGRLSFDATTVTIR